MSFFENTRRPEGFGGKVMVWMMNFGHRALAQWGMKQTVLAKDAEILDCGCGGGANIAALLRRCPEGNVFGIDYSPVSVEKTRRVNRAAVERGRCEIVCGSVAKLPFEDARFDLVTAFETVYFWPNLTECFGEVRRVLRQGGTFLVCNESDGENKKDEKWTKIVGGMTIYDGGALKAALEKAGFRDVKIAKNEKGWLCVTARK